MLASSGLLAIFVKVALIFRRNKWRMREVTIKLKIVANMVIPMIIIVWDLNERGPESVR
jgi:hypothetical protein